MSETTLDGTKVEICEVCGIKRVDEVFYFSFNNTPVVPNKVFSRVCTHIQNNPELKSQCINTKGQLREEYTYTATDAAMEAMMQRFNEN